MSIEEIRSIALEIQNDKGSNKKERFESKYPQFFEHYGTLANMCCEGLMETQRLDFMLSMLEKVRNNSVTQEGASEAIGQDLFNKYVAPKLNKN